MCGMCAVWYIVRAYRRQWIACWSGDGGSGGNDDQGNDGKFLVSCRRRSLAPHTEGGQRTDTLRSIAHHCTVTWLNDGAILYRGRQFFELSMPTQSSDSHTSAPPIFAHMSNKRKRIHGVTFCTRDVSSVIGVRDTDVCAASVISLSRVRKLENRYDFPMPLHAPVCQHFVTVAASSHVDGCPDDYVTHTHRAIPNATPWRGYRRSSATV